MLVTHNMNQYLQGVALYITLGLLCTSSGLVVTGWQFWAFITLFWAMMHWSKEQGRVETSTVMIIALKEMGVDIDRLVKAMNSEK